MNLISTIGAFVFYVCTHVLIGMKNEAIKKEILLNPNDKELQKKVKYWNELFKWYPAIVVVIIILAFVL